MASSLHDTARPGGSSFVISNARIVLCDEVICGSIEIRDGRIRSIDPGGTAVPGVLDLDGDYLVAGLIELHTDNFERHLMPRPKVRWPEMPALIAHDAEIAAAGITTVLDALGVGEADQNGVRNQHMQRIVDVLDAARTQGVLRADHFLHIRCELPAPNTRELFEPFVDRAEVALISLMDHTPGQRQWTDLTQAKTYWTGKKGWTEADFARHVAEAPERQARYALPNREHFVAYACARGIPLASHDDTTTGHVEQAKAEGMVISEFPTCEAAAQRANELGLAVIMGGPNVVRGGSHSGNVAAIDLARAGLLDIVSSDYVPNSLLNAAIQLTRDADQPLAQAIATVSANPARAMGMDDRGEIAIGRRADLVRMKLMGANPVVRAVWRAGERVS